MFPKVLFAFYFVRTFPFLSSFLKLFKNALCYALIWNLVCPPLSPAWGAFHGEQDEEGGTAGPSNAPARAPAAVATTLPDVPEIPWRELETGALIGRGSFGDVHAGKWRGMDVAIKVLHVRDLTTEAFQRQFDEEVAALWTCQFPRVVRLYGICKEPGHYAMVFERMQKSLYDWIHGDEPLSDETRLRVAVDLALGLTHLHTRPVLHRDLKSQNVLIGRRGRAKISDFGSARIRTMTATQTGRQVQGTVRWTAPELFGTHPKATAASDIYSYGVILWELLTGKVPFKAQTNELVIMGEVRDGKREAIPRTCPDLWREIIEACWKQNPLERPTAQAILAKFMADSPPPPPLWLPAEKPSPDQPLRAEGYVLYPASERDWKTVLTCYQHHPVPGYDVGRIEVVFNPRMNARFEAQMALLQQRTGNARYAPRWRDTPDRDQRAKVLSELEEAAGPYGDDDSPDVHLLPVWHGTQKANLPSLLSAGYGAFCTTDDGFFGVGIYAALEAQYSKMYADGFPPTHKNGILILNWGITHSSYPILFEDFDAREHRLAVKIPPGIYDSHFIPVIPSGHLDSGVYIPPFGHHKKFFTEIVFMDAAQIVPRYLVTLQPQLPSEPKNQELTMQARLREKAAAEQALQERAKRRAQREAEALRQTQEAAARLRAEQAAKEALEREVTVLRQERETFVRQQEDLTRKLELVANDRIRVEKTLKQQVAEGETRLRAEQAEKEALARETKSLRREQDRERQEREALTQKLTQTESDSTTRQREMEALRRQLAALQARLRAAEAGPSSGSVPRPLDDLMIPDIARGFEAVYRVFLGGTLVYKPNKDNDEGRVEWPIWALADPLRGEFDLSRLGDRDSLESHSIGEQLSINTGYRTRQRPENANKLEIWIAPRFLIERNLQGDAARFRPIMEKWDGKKAPIGLFWTFGPWDDRKGYDYLTDQAPQELGNDDLCSKWLRDAITPDNGVRRACPMGDAYSWEVGGGFMFHF